MLKISQAAKYLGVHPDTLKLSKTLAILICAQAG